MVINSTVLLVIVFASGFRMYVGSRSVFLLQLLHFLVHPVELTDKLLTSISGSRATREYARVRSSLLSHEAKVQWGV